MLISDLEPGMAIQYKQDVRGWIEVRVQEIDYERQNVKVRTPAQLGIYRSKVITDLNRLKVKHKP